MFSKYFSIVIIPKKTSKVKKIKIPIYLVWLFSILAIGLVFGSGFIIIDYIGIRSKLASLEENKISLEQQQAKIENYERQYLELEAHFNHLQTLNTKLKSMFTSNVDNDRKSRLRSEDAELMKEKIQTASKSTVLEVIASDTSEFDVDLRKEKEFQFQNLIAFFKDQKNPFERIPAGMPVTGFLINEFGMRVDAYTGQIRPQNGIDIAASLDSPIIAPADGLVMEIKEDEHFGNMLTLDHGNGFKTRYGHISGFQVETGEIVGKGDLIALVGNTGRTTGPRLYYEVLFNEVPQNPVKYSVD